MNPPSHMLIAYVHTDIPVGITCDEYRRNRPRRPTRWTRLKALAGGLASLGVRSAA